jgi:hypothetical protein
MFNNRKTEAGLITVSDPGADGALLELPTVQCVHCGGHFLLKPPKAVVFPLTPLEAKAREADGKRTRGYCYRCNGYFCGPDCAECVPTELLLDNMERGRPDDFRPLVVGWTPAME